MAGGVSHCTLLLSREGQRERERGEETDDRRLRGPVTHRVRRREKRRDKKRTEKKKEGDKDRQREKVRESEACIFQPARHRVERQRKRGVTDFVFSCHKLATCPSIVLPSVLPAALVRFMEH